MSRPFRIKILLLGSVWNPCFGGHQVVDDSGCWAMRWRSKSLTPFGSGRTCQRAEGDEGICGRPRRASYVVVVNSGPRVLNACVCMLSLFLERFLTLDEIWLPNQQNASRARSIKVFWVIDSTSSTRRAVRYVVPNAARFGVPDGDIIVCKLISTRQEVNSVFHYIEHTHDKPQQLNKSQTPPWHLCLNLRNHHTHGWFL